MTLKQAIAEIRKELESDELDANMKESYLISLESMERYIGNKFARRKINLVRNRDKIDKIRYDISRAYSLEYDTGYDFYCELVETEDYDTSKRTLTLFLLDIEQLR